MHIITQTEQKVFSKGSSTNPIAVNTEDRSQGMVQSGSGNFLRNLKRISEGGGGGGGVMDTPSVQIGKYVAK